MIKKFRDDRSSKIRIYTNELKKEIEPNLPRDLFAQERLPDAFTNEVTAWHEAGHAVVSLFSPHSHPIHRLTIIPRESDLG